MRIREISIHPPVRRLDDEPAAGRHRVPGVDAEVEHALLQLAGVALDDQQVAAQVRRDLDCLFKGALDERESAGHDVVQVNPAGAILPDPRGVQELPDERGRLDGSLVDGLERLIVGITHVLLAQKVLGIPHDPDEDIVEGMGYASRQGYDGLHLLGLDELLFQVLFLGYVLYDPVKSDDVAALIFPLRSRNQAMGDRPVFP